jgi:hypothetical protein
MSNFANNGIPFGSLGDWCPPGNGQSSDLTPLTPQLELTAASERSEPQVAESTGNNNSSVTGNLMPENVVNTQIMSKNNSKKPNIYSRKKKVSRTEPPNGRRRWLKSDNKAALECYYQAEVEVGRLRRVGDRVHEL